VTPINSGAVVPAYGSRGEDTFHALDQWVSDGFTDKVCRRKYPPFELAFRQRSLRAKFSVMP
jgi:hypothetical protein